ncbi:MULTISPECIES: SsrA-binding protein SmpB [unclassified Oceanobacter]|jgi:SsrA-binding protein|uniref:SsrA-binding protein SmpB n=1 Tax=unclassified Oceanobacter TaxID=2620260 RepID=UPI0026E2A909|nr:MULTISPECIES: SsrA-binding protein SmpB [unclassified Oceanobacter]MDO6681369.1 SsrA-binding protein SmpB [Oceanobacter sp. 5_MG-2023]MDP2505078.1 SsrA-binding protein SmpB [Oceanobacter sp. 3_MG-2023]MDP2548202.1 SsrA-binding protein SmpB [Oceanobacter sp. 4_MG-2023]MDP2608124.1 SsrA-binding protein SmpB [Oceanobacter sp. 1_MG-2023]MDP2611214.1 SsrA-binding protein SmpB [Oceanobacter sp. 2_MG-2023]
MSTKKKPKAASSTIALNKRARHDYFLEDKQEAGVMLSGWEVKALREGKCQLLDSYVTFHKGEVWLTGALITPLNQASSHIIAEPRRERKLLLHAREIERLEQKVLAKGYTCVCTALYWKGHRVKAEIALAKGKQSHDKRAASKDRDWAKQKERIMKHSVR